MDRDLWEDQVVDKDSCLLLLMRWGREEGDLYLVRNRCCNRLAMNHRNVEEEGEDEEEVVVGGETEEPYCP